MGTDHTGCGRTRSFSAVNWKAVIVSVMAAAIFCGIAQAQPKADKPAPAKESPKPETPAKEAAPKPSSLGKLLRAPKSDDPKDFAEFIRDIRNFQPRNEQQTREFAEQAPAVIKAACAKILALDKDPKSDAVRLAELNLTALRLEVLYENEDADVRKNVLADALKFMESCPEADHETAGLALLLADILENVATQEEAVRDLPKVAAFLSKSKIDDVVEQAKGMLGVVRRLQLPGNVMNLKGKTVDGKPFDLASLKGKVVLVDYWATWCGFCVAEIPHMKKLRKAYGSRGFEIVGVNLDEDKADLVEFLKKNKLPWPILYDEENGGQHPSAEEYGVTGLPTVMLVDAAGKVISLDARGDALDEHLKKLLGPLENPGADAPALPPEEPSTDTPPAPPQPDKK